MASCYTEPASLSAWKQDEDEEENGSKSPQRSSSDESDELEPEPPLSSMVRRKVSFADAFGLDLVSVKEFDNRVESAERREGEEFHLSCIFSVPSSDEELKIRLEQNKLELESIELLLGSTTIRGTVRVLNLSYHKVIYVRTTLDGWQSHSEQLAQYIPGSSDGETDRFVFQFDLMPPFPPDGARVEFCFRYESSAGIFWANNGGMNYVLFCHGRGGRALKEREEGKERETEDNDQKGKKSCLKAVKKGGCAESKLTDTSSELSEQESPRSDENKNGKSRHKEESQSKDTVDESCKTLAERRNRQRAAQVAYLQEYFSQRETGGHSGQPSHKEKSERDINVAQHILQNSIPVMTDTAGTLTQVCSKKEQNENATSILPNHHFPLLTLDWGTNISSPSSHPNTSETVSRTMLDVLEKEKADDASAESNDANHNNALDQKCLVCVSGSKTSQPSTTEYDVSRIGDDILSVWNSRESCSENKSYECFTAKQSQESSPAKLSQTLDTNFITEALTLNPEKAQIGSEPNNVQESESVWTQWRSGVTETSHDRHVLNDRPLSEVEPILLTNPGETAHADDATEPMNNKPGVKVLLEVCDSCTGFIGTEMKVKGDTHQVAEDTLTFTRIRNQPCTDRKEPLETQHTDQTGEPKKQQEQGREDHENASQMKSSSSYSEEALVALESRLKENDEDPAHLKDWNTEIWISSRTTVVCDEGELHKQTGCLNSGEEDAGCYELEKRGFSVSSERQGDEISSVEDIAERECDNDSKAEGQSIYKKQSEDNDCKDNELYMVERSPETFPQTPNSHPSSPSKHLTWTETVSEDELRLFHSPHQGFESDETLTYRVAQDLQDPAVASEFPRSISRTASPSVGIVTSWLLVCWAKTSTLSYITGALICAVLFVIFVTAYLHDLPVCLAIYLVSACWWCRQGMKKHMTTADSVD